MVKTFASNNGKLENKPKMRRNFFIRFHIKTENDKSFKQFFL